MKWEDIKKVNEEIKTTELKGKQYAEVKERVIAYRKLYPNGEISTEPTFTENYVMFKATATNEDGKVIAKGHARELLNKPFAVENAETSAIGRCLGFMGLGISTSIASMEDIENTASPSGIFDEQTSTRADLINEFTKVFTNEEQANILNYYHQVSVDMLSDKILIGCIDAKKHSTR